MSECSVHKECTIQVRYIGGSMHSKRQELHTGGLRPESVLVPLWGPVDDASLLRAAPVVGRETYVRDRTRDAGYGRAAVIAYVFDSVERL